MSSAARAHASVTSKLNSVVTVPLGVVLKTVPQSDWPPQYSSARPPTLSHRGRHWWPELVPPGELRRPGTRFGSTSRRSCAIRSIQTGAPGAAPPAERGIAASPYPVRLFEEAARGLHRHNRPTMVTMHSGRSTCADLATRSQPAEERTSLFRARSLALRCPYMTGAAVRSDHRPVGTMNTSIGSGAPLNCGFSMTGELERSAPQTAPSMSGV